MTNLFMNHNCISIISTPAGYLYELQARPAAALKFVYGLSTANSTFGKRDDVDSVSAAGTLLIMPASIGGGIEECRLKLELVP